MLYMVFVQIRKSLANRNPARIPKADKGFAKRLEFRDIKFPVKTKTIIKLKKIDISAFVYEDKEKHPIYK